MGDEFDRPGEAVSGVFPAIRKVEVSREKDDDKGGKGRPPGTGKAALGKRSGGGGFPRI